MSLKNIFIKDEEKGTEVSGTTQQGNVQMNATPFVEQSIVSEQTSDTSETIVKNLWQVLIDKNLPGPDYLEVKNTAAALQAMNLPIDKCYEAAFRTLQAANPDFTKQKLIDSIDAYINYVRQEQSDGKKECDRKRQIQIGEKTTRVSQLSEHKKELEKQIKELQDQIAQTEGSIFQLEQDIQKSTSEINREEVVFNNSIESVIASLNSDKNIMNNLTI